MTVPTRWKPTRNFLPGRAILPPQTSRVLRSPQPPGPPRRGGGPGGTRWPGPRWANPGGPPGAPRTVWDPRVCPTQSSSWANTLGRAGGPSAKAVPPPGRTTPPGREDDTWACCPRPADGPGPVGTGHRVCGRRSHVFKSELGVPVGWTEGSDRTPRVLGVPTGGTGTLLPCWGGGGGAARPCVHDRPAGPAAGVGDAEGPRVPQIHTVKPCSPMRRTWRKGLRDL